MPVVTFQVYRTTVVSGTATVSELVTISVNDADNSGSITRDEWIAFTGDSAGHIGGSVGGVPALWDGTTGVLGPGSSGFLYTATPIPTTAPENRTLVQSILDDIVHAPKYDIDIDELSICFIAGSLIATPDGDRLVESLRPGDLVLTRDHGPQPLVWTGRTAINADRLDSNPNLRPIRIAAGALGDGLPRRELCVSAQHRILIRDENGTEYLAAAVHLLRSGLPGFTLQTDGQPFDLVHIACARHEVVLAEGAATESFFTGPMAIRALSAGDRSDLIEIFPTLARGENPMSPARPFLKRKDVAALFERSRRVAA